MAQLAMDSNKTSEQCVSCCALYQGLHYLGHSSNTDNPDEKTIYGTLQTQQKELVGILLALLDQDMFASSVDGRVVSPDIDFLEWMVPVYSAVRGTRTEKDLSNWGFIRCPVLAVSGHGRQRLRHELLGRKRLGKCRVQPMAQAHIV